MLIVFLMGAGHRGKSLLKLLLSNHPSTILAGIYDPNETAIENAKKEFPNAKLCTTSLEMIGNVAYDVNLFMVCSINCAHLEHCKFAAQFTKNIFCEKPLCIDRQQLQELKTLVEENKLNFMTGFVLRHSPFYQKIKSLTFSLGTILTMEVHDNLHHGHGAHIINNWRRYKALSGGHLVEKCVHVFDLINWYVCGTDARITPVKTATFGRKDIWCKKNKSNGEFLKSVYGDQNIFRKFPDDFEDVNPFDNDATILHASVSSIAYSNGTLVNFSMNTFCPSSSRRFNIVCTFGEIEAVWSNETAHIKVTERGSNAKDFRKGIPCETLTYDFGPTGCHGNADTTIIDHIVKTATSGETVETDFYDAYKSTLLGISLEEAYEKDA